MTASIVHVFTSSVVFLCMHTRMNKLRRVNVCVRFLLNRQARAALRREDQNKRPTHPVGQSTQALKMPSEKGKSRGRKRKAIVEASEGTEESQDSPLTQGKGEKYVPRFSTKRVRNPRAKPKPCTPAEKLQVAENAATDQSGEV